MGSSASHISQHHIAARWDHCGFRSFIGKKLIDSTLPSPLKGETHSVAFLPPIEALCLYLVNDNKVKQQRIRLPVRLLHDHQGSFRASLSTFDIVARSVVKAFDVFFQHPNNPILNIVLIGRGLFPLSNFVRFEREGRNVPPQIHFFL